MAQEAEADPVPVAPVVIAHGIDMLEGALTAEQESILQSIAYQSAVSRVCVGLDLDLEKFDADFAQLRPEGEATEAQTTYHDRAILVALGVITGAFLGEYAAEPDEFCKDAEAFAAAAGDDTLFLSR
jgi:hypothetical protein